MSRSAPHLIVPRWSGEWEVHCDDCGQPIVAVRTEEGSRNRPHWRHKPSGYHWGDKAKRLRAALQAVADADPPGNAWEFDQLRATARAALRETT